jgi:hypothetical protein
VGGSVIVVVVVNCRWGAGRKESENVEWEASGKREMEKLGKR